MGRCKNGRKVGWHVTEASIKLFSGLMAHFLVFFFSSFVVVCLLFLLCFSLHIQYVVSAVAVYLEIDPMLSFFAACGCRSFRFNSLFRHVSNF